MAKAIADTYTKEDWQRVLNRLTPQRAARKISGRPAEDREYLLDLLDPEHRAKVSAYSASHSLPSTWKSVPFASDQPLPAGFRFSSSDSVVAQLCP